MNQTPQQAAAGLSREVGGLVELLAGKGQTAFSPDELPKLRQLVTGLRFEELLQAVELSRSITAAANVIEAYKSWIEVNGAASPIVFAAWFNLGVELSAAGDKANALVSYRNAIAIKGDFYQAAVNLGLQLEALGQTEEALETWKRALQPNDMRLTLLNHRGRLLEQLKRLDQSEAELRASLLTDPDQPDVIHHWVHLRQKLCLWPTLTEEIPGLSGDDLLASSGPLAALAIIDDVAGLVKITTDWMARKVPTPAAHLAPEAGYPHDKIRIGYMSSDFCMHAMSYLVAELFERHDRSRFEVYGYCSTREDGSEIRKRVIASFDHFTQVGHLTDQQLAQTIRNDEIDILVDLNGLTLGARLETIRWKPAPVQVTYLGYIGPLPLPELDYIICDDYVIPPDLAPLYHPKPLPLPVIYQANDSRPVEMPTVSRAEMGLPEDRFVFCCFSNHYKITEEIFDAWLEILKRTGDSVLWLVADNEWSCRNLTRLAEAAGIAADRLIFAGRVDHPRYLARMALPDLFLDTNPYNAGTIASDALRMGLPMVTLSGQTFSSRMAGSLLNAMGLNEGIALTIDSYIDKAVAYATQPELYRSYRERLGSGLWLKVLGDTKTFTGRFEAAMEKIVKRG
jgi:predicted O-linked N-acetylglucosamine transferase (SPINDLY family)